MIASRRHVLLLILAVAAVACSKTPEPDSDVAPFVLANALLDVDRAGAEAIIGAHYAQNARVDGALSRYRIDGGNDLTEVIFFADVRSARVSSVILKFRQDLDDEGRQRILRAAQVPEAAGLLAKSDVVEVKDPRGRTLRIRRADKNRQFTVTVEGAARAGARQLEP